MIFTGFFAAGGLTSAALAGLEGETLAGAFLAIGFLTAAFFAAIFFGLALTSFFAGFLAGFLIWLAIFFTSFLSSDRPCGFFDFDFTDSFFAAALRLGAMEKNPSFKKASLRPE